MPGLSGMSVVDMPVAEIAWTPSFELKNTGVMRSYCLGDALRVSAASAGSARDGLDTSQFVAQACERPRRSRASPRASATPSHRGWAPTRQARGSHPCHPLPLRAAPHGCPPAPCRLALWSDPAHPQPHERSRRSRRLVGVGRARASARDGLDTLRATAATAQELETVLTLCGC
jgi:hypothetical protein